MQPPNPGPWRRPTSGFVSMGTSDKHNRQVGEIPVGLQPPGEMNLAGYFLRGLLRRGLAAGGPRLHLPLVGARYLIRSGGMEVTLSIKKEAVEIRRGRWPRIDATVEAELGPLVALLQGGGMIGPWLEGKVRVRGKFWRLFPLVRLLRAGLAGKDDPEENG